MIPVQLAGLTGGVQGAELNLQGVKNGITKKTFYPPDCAFNETDGYFGCLSMEQSIALKLLKKGD